MSTTPPASPTGRQDLTLPVGPRDHVRGADTARVTLLEYGDFECPQCVQAYPIVAELAASWGPDLRLVFRNFPLTNAHPHAQRAAEAAEWAGHQREDAFWRMHDALYEQRTHLSDARILELAVSLGLDPASLEQAWAAHTSFGRVKEDFLSGLECGVTGTPTFFIDGVRYEGEVDGLAQALALARDG